MIIKDLKIELSDSKLGIECKVIIKRGNAFYAVPVITSYEWTKTYPFSIYGVNQSFDHFLSYCEKTDKDWVLIPEDNNRLMGQKFLTDIYDLLAKEIGLKETPVRNLWIGENDTEYYLTKYGFKRKDSIKNSIPYPYSNMSPFTSNEIELMNTPQMTEEEKALFKKRFEEWLNSPKTY